MRIRSTLAVVLSTLALSACLGGCGGTDVRVVNESTYSITELVVSSPSDDISYGSLAPGESSDYESFSDAYDRAAATFVASGNRFEIPPPDWSSREELGGGEWAYHLDIVDFGQGWAEIAATED
jgi:hypothetical protein